MKLLWVSGHCTTLPSDDKWWEGFDDPVLTRLVRLGETKSFNISMALHRIEMARQSWEVAKYLSKIIKPPKNLLKKSDDTADSTPTSGGV